MKNIHISLFILLITSCTTPKYEHIGQEIIDGKISKTSTVYTPYEIWVQTPTETKKVQIPFDYRNKLKVGDSCLLIIEKYKESETE